MSMAVAAPVELPRRKRGWLRSDFLFGYGLVILFVLLVAGLIVIHAGSVLNLGFPVGAAVLGFFLYAWRRGVYVAFVWWIWLFTPEVRRFVDFQTHYHIISPVMLTPLIVTSITMLYLLRTPTLFLNRKVLPFSIFALVLLYGLIIGVLVAGPVAAMYDFLNWFSPLCFGMYLLLDGERFAENRAAFISANMIGLLGTAGYGLYQFYHFPPWDAFWLANSNLHTAGAGVAEDVRLFGPLNSPLPYGIALMIPLALALVTKGPIRIVGALLGLPALGLSLVRMAWLGLLLSVTYIVARMGGKTRIRIILSAFVIAILAYPLLIVGPVATVLSNRLASFSNVQQDGSFRARVNLYETQITEVFSEPLGLGMGSASATTKLAGGAQGGFDSGVLEIPLLFGWAGTLLIIWAMAILSIRILAGGKSKTDRIGMAAAGIYLGMLLQPLGEQSFAGIMGLATWCFAAIAYRGKADTAPRPVIRRNRRPIPIHK